uniref:Uncharacterized protein n=1 Tax=Torrey Pines virus TaxID=1654361 RepID=A0A2Z4QKL6_9REOV|nr:hypothetical protein [Torrey Pines virus]
MSTPITCTMLTVYVLPQQNYINNFMSVSPLSTDVKSIRSATMANLLDVKESATEIDILVDHVPISTHLQAYDAFKCEQLSERERLLATSTERAFHFLLAPENVDNNVIHSICQTSTRIAFSYNCNVCCVTRFYTVYLKMFDTDSTFYLGILPFEYNYNLVRLRPTKDHCNLLCYGQCSSADTLNSDSSGSHLKYPFAVKYDIRTGNIIQASIYLTERTIDNPGCSSGLVSYIHTICRRTSFQNRNRYMKLTSNQITTPATTERHRTEVFRPIFSSCTVRMLRVVNVNVHSFAKHIGGIDFFQNISILYCPMHDFHNSDQAVLLRWQCNAYDIDEGDLPIGLALYGIVRQRKCVAIVSVIHTLALRRPEYRSMAYCLTPVTRSNNLETNLRNAPFQFQRTSLESALYRGSHTALSFNNALRGNFNGARYKKFLSSYEYEVDDAPNLFKGNDYGVNRILLSHIFDALSYNMSPKIVNISKFTYQSDQTELVSSALSYRSFCAGRSLSDPNLEVNFLTSELIMPCGYITTLFNPLLHHHGCISSFSAEQVTFDLCLSFNKEKLKLRQCTPIDYHALSAWHYKCNGCGQKYIDRLTQLVCLSTHTV